MIKKIKEGIPVYEFELLQSETNLLHFVTTRDGGCSTDNYFSLNLSYKVGDSPQNVRYNRLKIERAFHIIYGDMLFPGQCHSNIVAPVHKDTSQDDLHEKDALITDCKNQCISILAADCVPVLLYDPEVKAVAAIHAGWRGTIGRIVDLTVGAMVRLYHASPQNLIACIGPSISQKNYEVGDEVVKQFKFWFDDAPDVFLENPRTGKTHIDLWEANRQLLLRSGVSDKNIEVSSMCTFDLAELFFSARRDGIQCGRFATGIMLT
jgi:YfiH family protein